MHKKLLPHYFVSRLAVAIAALSAIGFMTEANATNGYFSHGYGIKAKGLAGAGIALPQDAFAIATNPAGLVDVVDQFSIGVDWFRPDRGAEINGNAFGADQHFDGNNTKDFSIPEIGYSHRINEQLSSGIAIYGNGGMNTDYSDNPYARFGGHGSAGVDLSQLFISPALAYRITDSQSIGAAVNFAYQRFKAHGIGVFAPFSLDPEHLSNKGYDTSTGWGVRLGWNGKFGDFLTVGATWQSKTRTEEFKKYRGLFAEQGSFDIPENYGFGLAIKPNQQLAIALDWQKIKYSQVDSVGNSIANLFAGNALGSNNGGGFGWDDSTVVKLGASYQVNDALTVRAGYSHTDQPVPDAETFFNILAPGVVSKHATVGATWAVDKKSEVSASYMHGFKETVHGANSIPAGFPPAGLGGGNADIHLEENSLGVGYTYKY
ncbi:MAG: long-chain fatty acid transporter [Verrucomicrobiaceae bacterium]|nr:long-chain fatty acid transporter [Verrucomicrobiaceae bacterium]